MPTTAILAVACPSWKDSANRACPKFECASAAPEWRPAAPQSFPLPQTKARSAPPAARARSLPPNGIIVGCSPGSWRDIPSGCRSRRQQPSMPREKVFEAQVGHEVSRRGRKSVIILLPVARQYERLRLVLPLHALDIEPPQIPFCARHVRRVRVQVLDRQRCKLRRSCLQWTQIPLRHRDLRYVHGLHDQFAKGILRRRKRRGRQESREFGK